MSESAKRGRVATLTTRVLVAVTAFEVVARRLPRRTP